jgi:hypothetical protein
VGDDASGLLRGRDRRHGRDAAARALPVASRQRVGRLDVDRTKAAAGAVLRARVTV